MQTTSTPNIFYMKKQKKKKTGVAHEEKERRNCVHSSSRAKSIERSNDEQRIFFLYY